MRGNVVWFSHARDAALFSIESAVKYTENLLAACLTVLFIYAVMPQDNASLRVEG